jgi:peptidoglycan/LPS O-acetylase OafA/YrhL
MQLLSDNSIFKQALLFALVAVLTYFVSIVSFALIELPAMNYGHAVARRLIEGRAGVAARESA